MTKFFMIPFLFRNSKYIFLLLLCSIQAQTKKNEILSLKPFFYEDFEDVSTEDFFSDNTSGNTAEWVDTNRPTLVKGPLGNAMDFHGVNAAFRIHSYGNFKLGNFSYSDGFSCSFWIKHKYDHSVDRNQYIVAQENFKIAYSSGLAAIFDNEAKIVLGPEALDGTWHHVVIVADYSKETNNVTSYLDNKLMAVFSYDFSASFSDSDSRRAFYVGKRNINTNYAEAALDELVLFNRALSTHEIKQLYEVNTLIEDNPAPLQLTFDKEKTIVLEGSSGEVTLTAKSTLSNPTDVVWKVTQGDAQIQKGTGLSATISLANGEKYEHAKIKLTVGNDKHQISKTITVARVNEKIPGVRSLSELPPPGVHPRILFGPDDLENLRLRFRTVPYIQTAMDYMLPIAQEKSKSTRTSFEYMVLSYNALMENNKQILQLLATEFTEYVVNENINYIPDYTNNLVHDVDMYYGFVYDFLFNYMTVNQQNIVRSFISRMIANRKCFGAFGEGIELEKYSTNWVTFHDTIVVCAAAIEGETGEMPEILEANEDKMRNFLCYNGVHDSGYPREGYGYYMFGMQQGIYSAMINARRGENFFETSNFHKSIEIGFREQQPWSGGNMYSHHDGQGWGNGYYVGNPVWIAKYMYPNDKLVDYHYQTYADRYTEPRKMQLATLIFGLQKIEGNDDPGAVGTALGLKTTAADLERGIINTRSKWGDDMVRFDFECRMDGYYLGHLHSDRNMFTLSGYGRQWIADNDYHDTKSDEHATVLIDGLAYDCGNRAAWRSAPGILLRYEDSDRYMLAQGDATFAYNYHFPRSPNATSEFIEKKWSEFTFPGTTIPEWQKSGPHSTLGKMNRLEFVDKAIRTVVFTKGDYPFVLVVDDIKKDENSHDYEWVANIPFNATNQTESIFDIPVQTADQIVLKYKSDLATNAPQLLVQLLESNGDPEPFQLVKRDIGTYEKEKDPDAVALRHMISLQRKNIVEPNFKMLLYPHRKEFPQPKITWNDNHTQLNVVIGEEETVFKFSKNNQDRTVVTVMDIIGVSDSTPFTGIAHEVPGKIEFEAYDLGGPGVGYADTTIGNIGNKFRNDDVDLQNCPDIGGGFNVGWVQKGEFLNYTINVTKTDNYFISIRQAALNDKMKFHIEIDGTNSTGTLEGKLTGNWGSYTDVLTTGLSLDQGLHKLKFVIEEGSANLNYMTIGNESLSLNTEATTETKINLIPNPGNHLVMIEGLVDSFPNWRMIDITGRTVLKGSGNVLNSSSLSSGVFFFVYSENKFLRFVKY